MEKIKIGWSEIDITPKEPIALAGQFYERVSEYVESEITATAMAIQNGEEKAIIISCDLTSVNIYLVEKSEKNLLF